METENKSFFRFPAEKVAIRELEEGKYVEEKEQNPNYLVVNETKKIFRINVIATIVHQELRGSVTSILVDDGTGKIVLRLFEENNAIFNLEIGDVVQVIGKVRVFNQEKYIFPEIIKKTNSLWLKVRFLELSKNKQILIQTKKEEAEFKLQSKEETEKKEVKPLNEILVSQKEKNTNQESENFEVVSEEIEENDPLLPYEKISKLINQLDKGEGVMIEEIIEKSPLEKTEELIEKMLENGDIFQNMPGKVRLL